MNIFLSHRIDFLTPEEAAATARLYRCLLSKLDVQIISMADELASEAGGITDEAIVSKSLYALKECEALVFDCSIENWNYIGCIFEVAYAFQMGKPIIVYAGNTTNKKRPWLRCHATVMATRLEDVQSSIANLLRVRGELK
jgi:hypothetical protein